ncbi:unnamed protein product, partial [Tuber aestivum]
MMANSIWVSSTEKFLIEALLKRVRQGERAENGFKKAVWAQVVAELNAKFKEVLPKPITVMQAKNKEVILKCEFEIVRKIRSNSGFGWDEFKGIPTVPALVWQEYTAVHKEAGKYRHKGLPHYELLEELFSGVAASGRFARTGEIESAAERDQVVLEIELGTGELGARGLEQDGEVTGSQPEHELEII